jgi:gp16 family phage-associated protein
MATKNPEDVKAELARKGVSISQWSAANGLSVVIVYGLLAGRRRGYRGESHRAAVLLGLKEGEVIHPSEVKQALAA